MSDDQQEGEQEPRLGERLADIARDWQEERQQQVFQGEMTLLYGLGNLVSAVASREYLHHFDDVPAWSSALAEHFAEIASGLDELAAAARQYAGAQEAGAQQDTEPEQDETLPEPTLPAVPGHRVIN